MGARWPKKQNKEKEKLTLFTVQINGEKKVLKGIQFYQPLKESSIPFVKLQENR